jgi:hypothetical protein
MRDLECRPKRVRKPRVHPKKSHVPVQKTQFNGKAMGRKKMKNSVYREGFRGLFRK